MKKVVSTIALVLASTMIVASFAACGNSNNASSTDASATDASASDAVVTTVAE